MLSLYPNSLAIIRNPPAGFTHPAGSLTETAVVDLMPFNWGRAIAAKAPAATSTTTTRITRYLRVTEVYHYPVHEWSSAEIKMQMNPMAIAKAILRESPDTASVALGNIDFAALATA